MNAIKTGLKKTPIERGVAMCISSKIPFGVLQPKNITISNGNTSMPDLDGLLGEQSHEMTLNLVG